MLPTAMASAQTCSPIAAGDKTFAEDEFVVVCVFCARMRSREGPWISLPLWLSRILRQEPDAFGSDEIELAIRNVVKLRSGGSSPGACCSTAAIS